MTYDSARETPSGTTGAVTIPEYLVPAVPGISVNTTGGTDIYGNFSKVPVINGYAYNYSIVLGSTLITHSNGGGTGGGYIRGISYNITVPAGASTIPYTMTYAYAMVLEDGQHNSSQQPLFKATLNTSDSIISCASPEYYLPTFNNADPRGGHATLDTTAARLLGFTNSRQPSPNLDPNNNNNPTHLYDVWYKGWTEVTFDLSPYRGQTVTLTFEADNCVPGGHFAYAYVALRNSCGGLIISGNSEACDNTNLTYSIPALGGADYQWTVPTGWTIISGDSTNIITVKVGKQNGVITAGEQNSCANLKAVLPVTTAEPPVGGTVTSDARVCTGNNINVLHVNGQVGNIIEWISSTDGINWSDIANTTTSYTAKNLTATTSYKAVIQSNTACPNDSGTAAVITVDPKSVGGNINPSNSNYCLGQDRYNTLTLTGNVGSIINWQLSNDQINWANASPADTDPTYDVSNIVVSTNYRTIVKSGVCPADTSSVASIKLYNVYFPKTVIEPADTSICYGAHVPLTAVIGRGSSYTWDYTDVLNNPGDGTISATPYVLNAEAVPSATTNYVLNITNAGCPVILKDTFHINVVQPFIVSAGNDTTIVVNQPLQLRATSTDVTPNTFTWSPALNLDNATIANPVAVFTTGTTDATYTVTGIDSTGCFASGTIHIKVYNVPPDLYVPSAFSPNGDGLNDVFKPILIGMKSLTLFRIYNRWGQVVFSTANTGNGWDGSFGGFPQDQGTYVWIADGIDYLGKIIQQKGNVVLVR